MVAPSLKDRGEESPGGLDRLVAHKERVVVQHGVQEQPRIGVGGVQFVAQIRVVERKRQFAHAKFGPWTLRLQVEAHAFIRLHFEDQRVRVAGAEQGVWRWLKDEGDGTCLFR